MNKRNVIKVLLSLFIVLSFAVNPLYADNQKKVLSLAECLDAAVNNNLSLKKADKKLEWGDSRIGEAKADYFPRLDFNAEYFRTDSSFGKNADYSTSFDMRHTLFDFGARASQVKIERINLELYRYEREGELQKTLSAVRQEYYSGIGEKGDIIFLHLKKQLQEKKIETVKEMVEAGLALEKDVLSAERELLESENSLRAKEESLHVIMARLSQLTGIENAGDYDLEELDSLLEKNKAEINEKDAVQKSFQNRPELKAYDEKRAGAVEKISREKKLAFPSLSWGLNYVFGGAKFLFERGITISGILNIPLFRGFATRHRIKQAEAELAMLEKELDIKKQDIEIEVRSSIKDLHAASKGIEMKKKLLDEALFDLMVAEEKYHVGLASEIDIMKEQVRFGQVSKEYNDSVLEHLKAHDKYELSTGKITLKED